MKNVLMIGQFTDISGYGNAARNYFQILTKLDEKRKINLNIINFSFERNKDKKINLEEIKKFSLTKNLEILCGNYDNEDILKIENYIKEDYELIFFLTNDWLVAGDNKNLKYFHSVFGNILNLKKIVDNSKKLYPCVVWETDGVPKIFKQSYIEVKPDKLVCACEWNKEVFERDTNTNGFVIPYPIKNNVKVDNNFLQKLNKIKKDSFAFCSVFQWTERKGVEKLIKSFLLEFKDEDVVLFIKTYINKQNTNLDETSYFLSEINRFKKSLNDYDNNPEYKCKIVVLNQILTEEEINSIYEVSDCYISTTKGEGFGLPIAEFIKFKKPVCVPNKGGHIDFIHKDNYFIESNYEPVENLDGFYSSFDMNYVEVSVKSTMNKMRACYEDKNNNVDKYKKIGENSYQFLNSYLNFDIIEKKFEELLEI